MQRRLLRDMSGVHTCRARVVYLRKVPKFINWAVELSSVVQEAPNDSIPSRLCEQAKFLSALLANLQGPDVGSRFRIRLSPLVKNCHSSMFRFVEDRFLRAGATTVGGATNSSDWHARALSLY